MTHHGNSFISFGGVEVDMGDLEFIQGKVLAGDYFQVSGDIDNLNDTVQFIVPNLQTAFLIEAKLTMKANTGAASRASSGTTSTNDQTVADLKIDTVKKTKAKIGIAASAALVTSGGGIGGNGSGVGGGQTCPFNVIGLSLVGSTVVFADGTVTCVTAIVDDTVTVNGLVYTGVVGAKANNTEFSIDTGDNATATDLADSITNDTRTGTDKSTVDQTALSSTNVVTITATLAGTIGNNVGLSSSDGVTLAVSGSTLTGGLGKAIEIENVLDSGSAFAEMSGYLIAT